MKVTGSIQTKTGAKNYYAVISYVAEDGKRKQKWVNTGIPIKGNNKRRAEARLRELIVEYEQNGGVNLSKDMDFMDFMVQFLEGRKLSLSPVTYDGYIINLNAHIMPFFKRKKLNSYRCKPCCNPAVCK